MPYIYSMENGTMGIRQSQVGDQGERDAITWEFDGIRMGHSVSRFKVLTHFSASSPAADVVRLHMGLRGNYSFEYRQLDRCYDLIGGHANILYSPNFDMVVHNRTLELETFGVQFPRELFIQFTQNASDSLQRFAQSVLEGRPVVLSDEWGAVDPAIHSVIRQVLAGKYTGDLQRLFLLSKSIELLVLCAESCSRAMEKKDVFLKNPSDKEKIIAARDLVNDRLDSPPSLSEIATAIGLNEFKLKRGFKEVFQTTVFGYLAEQRLQLAWQSLHDTRKTAAEISCELGYSTPQHFNNAFKKRFGVTPHSIRNNP